MGARGRPLRFLLVVLGGWTALRVAVLWPAPPMPPARTARHRSAPRMPSARVARPSSLPEARLAQSVGVDRLFGSIVLPARSERGIAGAPVSGSPGPPAPVVPAPPDPGPVALAAAPPEPLAVSRAAVAPVPAGAGTISPRLHGDSYLVVRGGRERSLAFGELGASQAGARLTYAIDGARRLALSARVSAPFGGAGREAAAGLDWRPTRLPVHLLIEDRYDLDAHRHDPAAELIAGVYAHGPLGLTLDAYAQGGAIKRRGAFADGAARLFRPVPLAGRARLELGVGGWGGAQRGAARVDLGPTASLAAAGVRLSVDYRLRVAGRASPGSGPALTFGAGF